LIDIDAESIVKTQENADLATKLIDIINTRLESHNIQLLLNHQKPKISGEGQTVIDLEIPVTQYELQER
jgi:hypothetical protein